MGSKTAVLDDILVEMLTSSVIKVIYWLMRIFNRCMKTGVLAEDWKVSYIVPYIKWG